MTRIAFAGRAGVGKTSAAKYLVDEQNFVKMALADKLKEICKDLWPQQFENGHKPRKLLQYIGSEGIRSYDPDVWVNYLVRQMKEGVNYTVDDVRFLNEAKILKDSGFIIVRIDGPCRIEMPEGTTHHVSETEIDKIEPDFILQNEGSLESLYNRIEAILYTVE